MNAQLHIHTRMLYIYKVFQAVLLLVYGAFNAYLGFLSNGFFDLSICVYAFSVELCLKMPRLPEGGEAGLMFLALSEGAIYRLLREKSFSGIS